MRSVTQAFVLAPLLAMACAKTTTVPGEPPPSIVPQSPTQSPIQPQPSDAASILVGAWASDDGSTRERWVGVGEHLVGVGFVSRDDVEASASFEVMLIHRVDGHAIFTALPGGTAIVDFGVGTEPNLLRLTNPEHDDPTQIVYRREGARLAVALDGAAGLDLLAGEPAPAPELEALDVAFSADSGTRGGAAWAERFEAQGFTWSRGSTRKDGPEAIGAGIDAMRAGGHELSWAPTASGMAPAGDMGFTTGRYRLSAREGGELVGTGTYVTIWRRRRQADGWRIAFDTGVPDPPPSSASAETHE